MTTFAAEAGNFLEVEGTCPVCDKQVVFTSKTKDLRNEFACPICRSIPRERALFTVLRTLYPNWRNLRIHESSPIPRGPSEKLKRECRGYTYSQYDPSIPWGSTHANGHRSENLEEMTFENDSFDIFVTQDVFEHIFRPDLAAKEIARVLASSGAHIFTTPLVNQNRRSERRASLHDGRVIHHLPPVYHGNPMSKDGSLATIDWGYDILAYLSHHSGLSSHLYYFDDVSRGLHAPLIEVIVSSKVNVPSL
ncbi:methyltransferase domain-containing protein [Microvirga sp. 0TCS3.31]